MEQTKSLQKRGTELTIVIRYNKFYHKCKVVIINIISNSSSTKPKQSKKETTRAQAHVQNVYHSDLLIQILTG